MLSKTNDNNNRKCNHRSKSNCPFNGECLTQCIGYKSTSTKSRNIFVYYGTSEGEFNTRYNNHTKSFRHRECLNETELWKYVWNFKDYGLAINLSWEINKKTSQYQCGSKSCNLCLSEKVSIICADPDTLLNKRMERICKCHHRNNIFWLTLRKNCHGMVFNCLSQFLYKDAEQNWHISAAFFCMGLVAGHYLPFPLLIKFHGFHSGKTINKFHMTIICKSFHVNSR